MNFLSALLFGANSSLEDFANSHPTDLQGFQNLENLISLRIDDYDT